MKYKVNSKIVLFIAILITSICCFNISALEFNHEVNTESLLLTDLSNDNVLYSLNNEEVLTMGSTTKIMTYIVAIENISNVETTTIEIKADPLAEISGINASTAGFENRVGYNYTALDLLRGMMIPSGCDAALELAYYVSGGNINDFVALMNQKALELGMYNTHFVDVHGLSEENYTTANDLSKLTKYALNVPYFRSIVNTEYYDLEGIGTVVNTNYLIDSLSGGAYYYKYAVGVKTGYTDQAGKCLVALASKGDKEYLTVALGGKYDESDNYINHAMVDTKALFEYAFNNYTDNINIDIKGLYKSLSEGGTYQIEYDTDLGAILNWSSSNESVATVDQNGLVTALAMGETTIKVMTQTGNFDTIKISVDYYNGLEVSSWEGDYSSGDKEPIDFKAVKEAGFDYIIIRAGWGSGNFPDQNDIDFVYNVEQAALNGIPFGISFIGYAETEEEAINEAHYLLREINELIPDYKDKIALPIVYIMSSYVFENSSKELNTLMAKTFANELAKYGYKVAVFNSKEKLDNFYSIDELKANNIDLFAYYNPYNPDFSNILTVSDNELVDMWCYTINGYFISASKKGATEQSLIYMDYINLYNPTIKVLDKINGKVTYDLDNDKVIITVVNNEGYMLDKLLVNSDNYNYKVTKLSENTYSFMLLDKYDTLVIDPIFKNIPYQFIESAIKINEGLYFKVNGPLTLVDKVYINGEFLDPSNYILKNGSTVLILANNYLNMLKNGNYTLEVTYLNGSRATTNFTIDNVVNPETNDNIIFFVVVFIFSILGLGVDIYLKRRLDARI